MHVADAPYLSKRSQRQGTVHRPLLNELRSHILSYADCDLKTRTLLHEGFGGRYLDDLAANGSRDGGAGQVGVVPQRGHR